MSPGHTDPPAAGTAPPPPSSGPGSVPRVSDCSFADSSPPSSWKIIYLLFILRVKTDPQQTSHIVQEGARSRLRRETGRVVQSRPRLDGRLGPAPQGQERAPSRSRMHSDLSFQTMTPAAVWKTGGGAVRGTSGPGREDEEQPQGEAVGTERERISSCWAAEGRVQGHPWPRGQPGAY